MHPIPLNSNNHSDLLVCLLTMIGFHYIFYKTSADRIPKSASNNSGELIPTEVKTVTFGSPELGNQNAHLIASTPLQVYAYNLIKKDTEFHPPQSNTD